MGYLTEATSAEELSSLSASDAARFRDHLIGKSMKAASVRRVFGTVKAIANLTIREYGLTCPNVFANVFIIDQIRGWSSSTVGSSYGKGYELPVLAKWMKVMEG